MTRKPAVAGQFYPGTRAALYKSLDTLVPDSAEKIDALGAIVPHAGYIYSGAVAGAVFALLAPKDTYVVLSPNHTGNGARFAASTDLWKTPLGEIEVDRELLKAIMKNTLLVTESPEAHMAEHSVEVQIPFIQKTAPGAKIVPITVKHGSIAELKEIGNALATAIKASKRNAMVLASSDMTHYESREIAQKKDKMAIDKALQLDAEGLLRTVEKNGISMCGYIPGVIMLACAKALGAKQAMLVKYSDSGEVTGDISEVVGYAGVVVY